MTPSSRVGQLLVINVILFIINMILLMHSKHFFDLSSSSSDECQPHREPVALPSPQNSQRWDYSWNECVFTRRLLLVRHGHFDADAPDNSLSDIGERQVAALSVYLVKISKSPATRMESVVSSPALPARRTAEAVAKELNITLGNSDESLREALPVSADPRPQSVRQIDWGADNFRMQSAFHRFVERCDIGDGHPGNNEILKTDIIITHANVIAYFVLRALQLPTNRWLLLQSRHASVTEIRITSGGLVSLIEFGVVSHLNLADLTE